MIPSDSGKEVEERDRAGKGANKGCFILQHADHCGQLELSPAGAILGGRGTREPGY